jgi:tight adherence protein B
MIAVVGAALIGTSIALFALTARARTPRIDPEALGMPLAAVVEAPEQPGPFTRAARWWRTRKVAARFDDELPDALDLLSGSLEAGASLAQAMELVANEGRPPLSTEFARALSDNRLGVPLPDALDAAAARVGSRDFTWCARAVRVQQEYGASLAGLMRTLAEFMRFRQELRREVNALTAEGRMSAWILLGLPFLVAGFFMLVNPGYLGVLVTTPIGLVLTVVAVGLLSGGAFWMRRIVRLEV